MHEDGEYIVFCSLAVGNVERGQLFILHKDVLDDFGFKRRYYDSPQFEYIYSAPLIQQGHADIIEALRVLEGAVRDVKLTDESILSERITNSLAIDFFIEDNVLEGQFA